MSIEKNSTDTAIGFTSDEELMYICAFRYAFGRHSYITEFVSSFLRSKVQHLSTETLRILVRDLEMPKERYPGDECDKDSWDKLFLAIAYELSVRNKE